MTGPSDQPRTALHGSSGAKVFINMTNVSKIGDARTGDQGWWLIGHSHIATLPRVFRLLRGQGYASRTVHGYEMELLEERTVPGSVVTDAHVRALASVWHERAEVKLDLKAHFAKVTNLAHDHLPEYTATLVKAGMTVDWGRLHRCLTHGDPTTENVMIRLAGVRSSRPMTVVIDPVPATPAVPDLMCVDVGKLLQSAMGWNVARYSGFDLAKLKYDDSADMHGAIASLEQVLGGKLPAHELYAAKYWCAVHLLRTLPYMKDSEAYCNAAYLAEKAASRL